MGNMKYAFSTPAGWLLAGRLLATALYGINFPRKGDSRTVTSISAELSFYVLDIFLLV